MRKFLQSLMVFTIFVLGTICAMPSCLHHHGQAEAAASLPPCHGDKEDSDEESGIMFYKDCTQADLQKIETVSLEKPVLSDSSFPVFAAGPMEDRGFQALDTHTIRGPPPDWPDVYPTYPPIFLMTQRLRV